MDAADTAGLISRSPKLKPAVSHIRSENSAIAHLALRLFASLSITRDCKALLRAEGTLPMLVQLLRAPDDETVEYATLCVAHLAADTKSGAWPSLHPDGWSIAPLALFFWSTHLVCV